jgi:hypothetical protein
MSALNFSDRIERLQTLRREHRLIRNKWVGKDVDGRELACLLVALSPEVGKAEDPSACPASVIARWFAYLTPWLDDAGSNRAWEAMVARYVPIVARWHTLTPERDRCLEYAVRALAVREAMRHTSDTDVLAVCEHVALLCERVAGGGGVDAEAFTASAKAAASAASWATSSSASASSAATAAWASADAPASAARAADAADAAAEAAAWWAAASASRAAARASADRLTDAILGACERELELTGQVQP